MYRCGAHELRGQTGGHRERRDRRVVRARREGGHGRPGVVDGSIPPNKSDLKFFGVYQEGEHEALDS